MREILLSFKPEVYNKILSGEKVFEHRRTFPNEPIKAYMYVSSPIQAITGIVYLGKKIDLNDWKERFKTEKETVQRIQNYQESYNYAMPIERFAETNSISLSDLRSGLEKFIVPQSYYYLQGIELYNYLEEKIIPTGKTVEHKFNIAADIVCIN